MLKFACCLFTSVLVAVTVNYSSVEARPQLISPIDEALSKLTEAFNDTAINFIKHLTSNSSGNENKTKTRILFRDDLLGDFSDQDIIFPDTYQVVFDNIPKITSTPKCAKGQTFCETVDSYPYQQIQSALHRKRVSNDLFGKDEFIEDRYSITNRNGDFEGFICSSTQQMVFPRVGKNKDNKWKYIINQKENDRYVQGVRIEVCQNAGSACDLIGDRINGYITSCKQKYSLRKMMSWSENGGTVLDTFQLPSACCCSYKKDLRFLSSFSGEDISARNKAKIKYAAP